MSNRLYKYLTDQEILHPLQFGFRKATPPNMQLLRLQIRSTNRLRTTTTSLAFLFDTVNHAVLLENLEIYGSTGASLAWFRSYLTKRKQLTCINNDIKTNEPKVTCGLPQESILGLLLFSIYVNDLPSASNSLNTITFAYNRTFFEHKEIAFFLRQ